MVAAGEAAVCSADMATVLGSRSREGGLATSDVELSQHGQSRMLVRSMFDGGVGRCCCCCDWRRIGNSRCNVRRPKLQGERTDAVQHTKKKNKAVMTAGVKTGGGVGRESSSERKYSCRG